MKTVSKRMLAKVAHMYYELDLTQSDIAKQLGLERSTISKYLKKAKEANIVKIEIEDEFFQKLEYQLEEKFNMKEVCIIPTIASQEEQYANLGQAGGEILQRILKKNMVVGFNWGRSMSAISRYISQNKVQSIRAEFVPLVGGSNHSDVQLHGNTICYSLAQSFQAGCHIFYAPVIAATSNLKREIESDKSYQYIKQFWQELDIAFVGIGSPSSSSNVIWNENLRSNEIMENFGEDVVGETCTRFYNSMGNEVETSLTDRTISIELDLLKKIKYVVGVAAGVEKTEAIRAAMKGKLINILVTDEKTAMALLGIPESEE